MGAGEMIKQDDHPEMPLANKHEIKQDNGGIR
jgi:hypothetical protein